MTSRYLKSSTSLIIREMQINATTMSYHLTPVRITIIKQGEGEVAQSCPTLCDPVDCNLLGFSVHGILQARILEWIAISFSRGSSRPRDRTRVSRIEGRCFNLWATREARGAQQMLLECLKNRTQIWENQNSHDLKLLGFVCQVTSDTHSLSCNQKNVFPPF